MENLLIREVWASNLETEFNFIRHIVDEYPCVAMDTEFPGTVLQSAELEATEQFRSPAEKRYTYLRMNVDSLKLIQLGLTFSDRNGNLPSLEGTNCVWQFNFRDFNFDKDLYARDSIDMLRKSGIDFDAFQQNGVDAIRFAELLMSSGVVLNDDVLWITFHSCYDFAYLLKVLTCRPLPSQQYGFFRLLHTYCPTVIDIKYLMRFLRGGRSYGGLDKLAEQLRVQRIGPSHQAGSDSLLTSRVYFALLAKGLTTEEDMKQHLGMVHGLGIAADD